LKEIEFEKAQMIFPTSEGFLQVYVHKISYIESFGEDIVMHMMNKDTEMIKKPLYQIETLLKPFQFSRIGKSFIVNLRNIRYIRVTYYAKLELELLNKDIVYVSRSYVSKFKDALGIK
ncbi:MAG: LytTR family DNA-binding domain-containing protein, partial [Acholeplasmataceae bacterium]